MTAVTREDLAEAQVVLSTAPGHEIKRDLLSGELVRPLQHVRMTWQIELGREVRRSCLRNSQDRALLHRLTVVRCIGLT